MFSLVKCWYCVTCRIDRCQSSGSAAARSAAAPPAGLYGLREDQAIWGCSGADTRPEPGTCGCGFRWPRSRHIARAAPAPAQWRCAPRFRSCGQGRSGRGCGSPFSSPRPGAVSPPGSGRKSAETLPSPLARSAPPPTFALLFERPIAPGRSSRVRSPPPSQKRFRSSARPAPRRAPPSLPAAAFPAPVRCPSFTCESPSDDPVVPAGVIGSASSVPRPAAGSLRATRGCRDGR